MENLRMAVMSINTNPALLEKLRRFEKGRGQSQRLHKDAAGKEFLEAMFNGTPHKFYLGVPRVMKADIAASLVRSSFVPMDEDCQECYLKAEKRSIGRTSAGICPTCRGQRKVFVGDHEPIFQIDREYDPMLVDPSLTNVPAEPVAAAVAE